MNAPQTTLEANEVAAVEDENTLQAKLNAYIEENCMDMPEAEIDVVSSWFYLGALSVFQCLKEIQPADNKLSTIVTTAGQVANLEAEVDDYFNEDEATVLTSANVG